MFKSISKITKYFTKKRFIALMKSPRPLLLTSAVGGVYAYWHLNFPQLIDIEDKDIEDKNYISPSLSRMPSYTLVKEALCEPNINNVVPIVQTQQKLTSRDKKCLLAAFKLFNEGKYEKAYLTLLPVVTGHTELQMAYTFIERHQFEKAVTIFENFVSQYPEIVPAYLIIKTAISLAYEDYTVAEKFIQVLDNSNNEGDDYLHALHWYYKGLHAIERYKTANNEKYRNEVKLCFEAAFALRPEIANYPGEIKALRSYLTKTFPYHPFDPRNPENRVIVRVWLPKGIFGVGHVSLTTSQHYISFYPGQKTIINDLFKRSGRDFNDSLVNDVCALGQLPDVTAVICDLDVNTINKEFIKFKESNLDWSIFGSGIISNNQNCAGLTRQLLTDGGMNIKRGQALAVLPRTAAISLAAVAGNLASGMVGAMATLLGSRTVTPANIAKMAKLEEYIEVLYLSFMYLEEINPQRATANEEKIMSAFSKGLPEEELTCKVLTDKIDLMESIINETKKLYKFEKKYFNILKFQIHYFTFNKSEVGNDIDFILKLVSLANEMQNNNEVTKRGKQTLSMFSDLFKIEYKNMRCDSKDISANQRLQSDDDNVSDINKSFKK